MLKRVKLLNKGDKEDASLCQKDGLDPAAAVRLFESKILTNPSITDCIFADMPYFDLLNCSLVSKAWNMTCRSILVNSSNTYLTLSEESTVKELQDFYDLISNSVPGHHHPFNGIRVKFSIQVFEWPFFSEPFASLIKRIMELLEVKVMSFDMSRMHPSATDFHDIFKTLLIPHLATLEFLEILNFDGIGNLQTLSQQLKVDSLPNLRELELNTSLDRIKTSTFKRIMRACPNLKEFPYVLPYQLPTLVHTKKLHLASKVRINYMSLTAQDLQLLAEYGGLIQKLKIFQQDKWRVNKFEGEWISRLEPMFSSRLQLTLEFLQIDLELLVAILLQNSFPPLTNLKELFCRGSMAWFHLLFRNSRIRLSQFLPTLESLTIFFTPYKSIWLKRKYFHGDDNEGGPLVLSQGKNPGRLDSVRVLKLVRMEQRRGNVDDGDAHTKMMMLCLRKALPWVTHLDISFDLSELEELLKWICGTWGDLLQTLILRKTKCLRLEGFLFSSEPRRAPLPAGFNYGDKLSHLRRLELDFQHPLDEALNMNYGQETNGTVGAIFEPREGHEVQLLISGCRPQRRMSRVKWGVSVYDTIMALHPCPKNFELTLMEAIIATESICKKICKMLPTQDLLRVSRVSRRWNGAARQELHQSRICTLTINPLTYEEADTPRKLTWLSEGALELFNSLRIVMPCSTRGVRIAPTVLANTALLESLVLKHRHFQVLELAGLQKRVKADPGSSKYSADFDFDNVSTLLNPFFKNVVQKLELGHVRRLFTSIVNFDGLFRDDGGNLLVPNLKRIKFVDAEKLLDHPEVVKRLLEELQFLERIANAFSSKLLPHVTTAGRAHCVKHIQLYELPEKETLLDGEIIFTQEDESSEVVTLEDTRTALGSLLKFAQEQQPRVESLRAGKLFQVHPKNESCLRKLFQLLCKSSCESLNALRLSPALLRLISMAYTHPMMAVKSIELRFDQGNSDPDQLLLSQIPFPQMFPNLKTVILVLPIFFSSNLSKTSTGPNPQPYNSVGPTKLKIMFKGNTLEELNSSSPETTWNIIEYLARVFPNVSDFCCAIAPTAQSGNSDVINKILGSLWVSWPKLEIIKVIAANYIEAETFESWILGISKEEWNTWQEQLLQNDQSPGKLFRTMQYAPSTTCFRNCKHLKELWVNLRIKTVSVKTTVYSNSWKRLHLFNPTPDLL